MTTPREPGGECSRCGRMPEEQHARWCEHRSALVTPDEWAALMEEKQADALEASAHAAECRCSLCIDGDDAGSCVPSQEPDETADAAPASENGDYTTSGVDQ